MARSVSYVSAAKLLAMARGNPRVAIIDVRCRALASALRLSPTLRRADLVADVDEIVRFFLCVVGDCRDEERSYQAHIGGSHHFSSRSFATRLPELARATGDKDTVVFHCALSKVGPIPHTSHARHFANLRLLYPISYRMQAHGTNHLATTLFDLLIFTRTSCGSYFRLLDCVVSDRKNRKLILVS